MDKLYIILAVVGIYLLFKFAEGFVNFTPLDGFNDSWGDFENVKQFTPKKITDLETTCDEKRKICIRW